MDEYMLRDELKQLKLQKAASDEKLENLKTYVCEKIRKRAARKFMISQSCRSRVEAELRILRDIEERL